MKKLNLFFLIVGLLSTYACTAALTPVPLPTYTPYPTHTPVPTPLPGKENILVKVHVLTGSPPPGSEYTRREGEAKEVGVYEFYLEKPTVPGSGAFKKLDSIPLEKIDSTEFYGEKSVAKISGTLCIGYPSTNFIDGKACVEVDQSKDEIEITVHYWKTSLGIL